MFKTYSGIYVKKRGGVIETGFMTIEDAKMLCKASGVLFSKKTVMNLFAASKMTVIQDSDEKGQL